VVACAGLVACLPPHGGLKDLLLAELVQGFDAKLVKVGLAVLVHLIMSLTEQLLGPNADPDRKGSTTFIRAARVENLDGNRKPSFVLILLAMEDDHIHPSTKRFADVELSIIWLASPSSCGVRSSRTPRAANSTLNRGS
jgi:hypothetical protein